MSSSGSLLPGLGAPNGHTGFSGLGLSVSYHIRAERPVASAQVEYNTQTILKVAQEFSGLVHDMNRRDMTPSQLARLDSVIADFETIIRKVQGLRAELQAADVKVR